VTGTAIHSPYLLGGLMFCGVCGGRLIGQTCTSGKGYLKALDYETALSLGLYDDAKAIAEERKTVEKDLATIPSKSPALPPTATIATNAASAFDELDRVLELGTIEEKRELLTLYVQKIQADPNLHQVGIGLYSSLFTWKVAVGGFDAGNASVVTQNFVYQPAR